MMKKIIFISVAMIVFILLLVPVPLQNDDGLFNTFTGLIWCDNRTACLHEIGHGLDKEAGWISHSEKFEDAVLVYILVELRRQNTIHLSERIVLAPGLLAGAGYMNDTQSEVYARIFEFSGGREENMPESLREFYDWKRAKMLIAKFELKADQSGFPIRMAT